MPKVKAASLVLDFMLYPRHKISEENLRQMREAIRQGVVMPQVTADRKTQKVSDGFHRVTLAVPGEISVKWKDYANDDEILLDAIDLNAGHGLKLSAWDHARCVALAQERGIDLSRVAGALSITPKKMAKLIETKLARTNDGRPVALKRTSYHLAGKILTPKQMEANEQAAGPGQLFLVNQVIHLLETDLLDRENDKIMAAVQRLRELLDVVAENAA